MDAACLNFRGCHDSGEECNLTTRGYHLGFTDDLMQQIEEVHASNPHRRIYLSGFSLGAGVVTKLLGELCEKAYDYNICGAAVNAVPFDCGQNHKALNEPGFTKSVYGDRLLKSMKTRLSKQHDKGVFTFEKSEIEECRTIMDLENLAIAPPFGFDDAYDYYDKVKTVDKLQRVCVPQFVLQARDDPFFVGLEEVDHDETRPLRVQYTEHGGHCGYIFHQRDANERNSKTSWMPRQLARFLSHIEATSVVSERRNDRVVGGAARDCLECR
jgi:predicted alpha/beta-fold hydrolase